MTRGSSAPRAAIVMMLLLVLAAVANGQIEGIEVDGFGFVNFSDPPIIHNHQYETCGNTTQNCYVFRLHGADNLVPEVADTVYARPYRECMQLAQGTRAFQCRCTIKIMQCLNNVNATNCSHRVFPNRRLAEQACKHFVRRQNLGCSEKLCLWENSAGGFLSSQRGAIGVICFGMGFLLLVVIQLLL